MGKGWVIPKSGLGARGLHKGGNRHAVVRARAPQNTNDTGNGSGLESL